MEENQQQQQEQLAFDPNNIRSSHFKIRSSSKNRRQLKRISNPQRDSQEQTGTNQTQEDNQPNENGVSPIKTQAYRYKNYGGTGLNPSPIRPYNPPSQENDQQQQQSNESQENQQQQGNEMNIEDQQQNQNHLKSREDYNNNIEEIVDTLNTEVIDENEEKENEKKHNSSIISPEKPKNNSNNESELQVLFQPQSKKKDNQAQNSNNNFDLENPEQQQDDPIKQYKMTDQQKQFYENLQKTKEIWCTIKSLGSMQVNYDKAVSFLKRILKLESELDQVNAAIYTQPQNCKLYDQKQQKNEHTFYLQMSNIEVKDYEYLLNFTYVSQKTGSNIVFSATKPSTFVLNPVSSDIKEQDEEDDQQYQQPKPFQLGEKKSNKVFNVEEQLPYEPNQYHYMSSEKFESSHHIISDLIKLCCGFLNKDHFSDEQFAGKIYVGTSEQGHIEGVKFDDQKKQFKQQFLQTVSEVMQTPFKELIDVNICDIMEQYRLNRENLVIIEISIQKPEINTFASVKFKEHHKYYQRIKNKNPELLTSQLCMYVEDRISKIDLKRQIEFLEKHGGSSSPLRTENSPKIKPKGMRSSSHHDNVIGQPKILGRHQKLGNNNLPNFQQGTQSSSPEKKPIAATMTEKRDKRSVTADSQVNNKQHNIFKQSYNKQPLMMNNNQKYAFPKAKNNSLVNQEIEQATIPNTMRQSAHFQQDTSNSNNFIRENQSTLPPAFTNVANTEKIDKNKLKADAFLLNNNATLTWRESMLNNIGSKGNIFQQSQSNENNMNVGNFRNSRKLADLPIKAKNNIFNNNNLLNNNNRMPKNDESNPLSQYNIQTLDNKQPLGSINKNKLV